MDTKIFKHPFVGWIATTEEEFLIHGHKARLSVNTYKYEGEGLVTTASVGWPHGEGSEKSVLFRGALSRHGSGDFYRTLLRDPVARRTEKTVSAQHAIAIADWEQLKSKAAAHYPTAESLPYQLKRRDNAEDENPAEEATSSTPRQRG